jgi:Ca-activated chloride channel family protein
MQRGIAAYRAGDHAAAAEAFAGVDTADGHYNRGNALAKAGRYREAISAYDAALARAPGMPDALANKAAVQALLDREPPPGPRDSERGEGNDGQGGASGQAQDEGAPGQEGRSEGEGKPAPSPPPDASPETPPEATRSGNAPTPDDPEAQAAADAAQRERMREALERARQAGAAEGERSTPADETPAERERRLANEAWLRRVPDDPGGLLRRRFALEYQRRMRDGETP